ERAARPHVMTHQLIGRVRMIDRIAQRGDYFAVRNVRLDAPRRVRMNEVWTYLSDLALAARIPEMMRVPIDPLVVEKIEKLRLLDAVRQVHASLEHAMQPCGARSPRTDGNK